jgi:hypothetical protein
MRKKREEPKKGKMEEGRGVEGKIIEWYEV